MPRKKLLFAALLLPFFGLSGCASSEAEKPVEKLTYFDVPGFVADQVKLLENTQSGLQKTVGFGHEKPETRRLSRPDWTKELTLFREIDLNKKALQGLYTETRTQFPDGEKLLYTRNSDADAPFALVEITRQQQRVTSLRAVYEQENGLFFNREERLLTTSSNGRLRTYQIAGVQKVRFFDSLNYAINSRLP